MEDRGDPFSGERGRRVDGVRLGDDRACARETAEEARKLRREEIVQAVGGLPRHRCMRATWRWMRWRRCWRDLLRGNDSS